MEFVEIYQLIKLTFAIQYKIDFKERLLNTHLQLFSGKMVKLTVNGRPVNVSDGTTLLGAARLAGVHIPTLCYHPKLPSHGTCRLCLVNVKGEARSQPACITIARQGDVVDTDTKELLEFRIADAQWILERHENDCIRCEVNGACKLQSLVSENQWHFTGEKAPPGLDKNPEHRLTDHTSPSIQRDLSKCIECGLCVEACGESGQQQFVIGFAERGSGRLPVTVFNQTLTDSQCISCGQCTIVCPTGALTEKPHWHDVLSTLDAHRRISVVQVAPASCIAISEEFGMTAGTISTEKMINALRQLGFDYVFDTNFAADLTIMEEATELLALLKMPSRDQNKLPLFTSCCPGWVNWIEINRPDLISHLSTTKSPQQMHGTLTKRGAFAKSLGHEFALGSTEPYVVSVMPCTAKKDEAERPGLSGDIDQVITTRELAKMIKARGIAFNALPEEGSFDSPLGESTGAAQIFGSSGGVMEAVIRTVSHLMGPDNDLPLEYHQLRGVNNGVKSATIPGLGKVAVCNGIAAMQSMLRTESWRNEYIAIEVMACVGGCLGGGGEPKSMDPLVLEKRMKSIYMMDSEAKHRSSHENQTVQLLYSNELKEPNSVQARALLHTRYAGRKSKRLLLMRFLDCVDRRDANGVVTLFHPDATWSTESLFGDIHGHENIKILINTRLPPRKFGPAYKRHQIESNADDGDLIVITPDNERYRFKMEIEYINERGQSRMVIKNLAREIL